MSRSVEGGIVKILLVEDNPADVRLLQECLRHVTVPYHLSVVSDGEAATLANIAGGIVVMKRGTATVAPSELRQALHA